jgi:type IV secretion system protein VirB5
METALSKDKIRKKKTSKQDHFLNAQGAWNEVYGRAISSKRNWRAMCFVLAILLLAAIMGIAWQGVQSKIIPYVVVLDQSGQELHSGTVTKITPADTKIYKKELGSFVKKARLASVDRQLMKQNIDWIYAHMLPNTSAYKKLNTYYQNNNPFELVSKKHKMRIVDQINSILPVTDNTWSIEWHETIRNKSDGEIDKTAKYNAIVTVSTKNPETPKQRKHNPFGIWIVDIEWEKKS